MTSDLTEYTVQLDGDLYTTAQLSEEHVARLGDNHPAEPVVPPEPEAKAKK